MAMFTAAIVALVAFRTPWQTLAVAGGKGVWDRIFILYVIWPALLLYRSQTRPPCYDLGVDRDGSRRSSLLEILIGRNPMCNFYVCTHKILRGHAAGSPKP